MYQITIPQKIIYGDKAIDEIGKISDSFGSRTVIITDKLIVSLHLLDNILASLNEQKVLWKIFDGVDQEPTDTIVSEALSYCKKYRYDSIIAVGGGSCIDTAKAVAVLLNNSGSYEEFANGKKVNNAPVPLIAIPTTAGTGSEVTDVTVITDTSENVKYMIKQYAFLPQVAIVDSMMSRTSPGAVTAATGLDALCHSLESYISKKAQPITKLFSLSATKLIMENLLIAYQNPDNIIARTNLAEAALEAGIAFSNSSVTLIHGMSRPLGALYHIPHGFSNAILLEEVMKFTKPQIITELASIARYIDPENDGTDEYLADYFLSELHDLLDNLKVPNYRNFKIDKSEFLDSLDKMAKDAIASGSPANNPSIPTISEIKQIYLKSWKD
ncbi:iron-containing alcohol dehydrogenase [Lapidilactobacillus salsurivasis]